MMLGRLIRTASNCRVAQTASHRPAALGVAISIASLTASGHRLQLPPASFRPAVAAFLPVAALSGAPLSSSGRASASGSALRRPAAPLSATPPSGAGADSLGADMGDGSADKSKARRSPRKKRDAAAAEDAVDPAAAGVEAEEGTAKPPAAKRARQATKKPTGKAAAKGEAQEPEAAATPAEEGGEDGHGATAAKPSRARKTKAKAPAAKEAAAPAAGADGEEEKDTEEAKPKPKAKRGQKAEPLPVYSATTMRKPPPPEGSQVLKVLSWNVAGLRGLLKKTPDAISSLVAREGVDVVCLQEHKLQGGHTEDVGALMGLKGWHHHWACSTAKLGYSGVSVHTRSRPLSVTIGLGPATAAAAEGAATPSEPDPEHEVEGRVVTVELPAAFVVSVYVPNSGEGLRRLDYRVKRWDGALAAYVQGLEKRGKPVILTGDLNCAHKEIDIHAPKTNLRSAGFTVEERESFGRLLLGEVALVDTFRRLHPDIVAYTYYTRRFNCRAQNKGWRLDYFLTSSTLMPLEGEGKTETEGKMETEAATSSAAPLTEWRVYDSWILQDVYGSDHLPLGLTLVKTGAASA